MILDASAMMSILAGESDAADLRDRLATASERRTSVVSAFEAVMAVGKVFGNAEALAIVREFLRLSGTRIEAVGEADLEFLADAFHRYGRHSGHPARLNMGDCFSYALAKQRGLPLLYKGDDFVHTDLG